MASMPNLWHRDYDGTPRFYDRFNRTFFLPTPDIGRFPPMALANQLQSIPQMWPRPPADCKPVESLPCFEPSVPMEQLAFAPAIEKFNDDHAQSITKVPLAYAMFAIPS
jgi:hypothetical protein